MIMFTYNKYATGHVHMETRFADMLPSRSIYIYTIVVK